MTPWVVLAGLCLAYANGANDTFKGVATLFGSRTTDYRRALWWATGTTFAGSCAAILISGGLVEAFSGKGLVPAALTQNPSFLLAVSVGAALTVLLATILGFPISTTHALTGALIGAALAASGSVAWAHLGRRFFLPLAVSPFVSLALTGALYPALRRLRLRLGVERQMCLCVEGASPEPVIARPDGTLVLRSTGAAITVGPRAVCQQRYAGRMVGFDAQVVVDRLHFLSAGSVSFARGLNDTPKIVALLVASASAGLSLALGMCLVGLAMAAGGLVNARRVATTMSERITAMNHGQGFTANLVTALVGLAASRFGLPMSTTHVSCGSLFGVGAATGQGNWRVIRSIALSWVITLPCAALVAGVVSRWLG